MYSSARDSFSRYLSTLPRAVFSVTAAAVLLQGCANPGPPRPPSLHLPALATGIKAERVGGQVLLSWTTPDKTSDGLLSREPITAMICREAPRGRNASVKVPDCSPVSRVAVKPGESHAVDALPPVLTADPPGLLVYRIELLNSKERSAGVSAPAFAAAGAAPADPGPIRVSASRRGAVIEWTPQPAGPDAVMEVSRTLTADAQGPVVSRQTASPAKPPVGLPSSSKKDPAEPVLLEAAQVSKRDPGGLLDPGAAAHETYVYTAQRVRTVSLGGQMLELRSAPSPAATFEYMDVIPPRPPAGLESVASAPLSGPASIDLSWETGGEGDSEGGLRGYNVYRSDSASGGFARLNPAPIQGQAFRDMTAQLGHSYRYRVTAVDRFGNESAPSKEIEESLRQR